MPSLTDEIGDCLYAVTARKPSAVSHAARASFTSAQEKNLIVVKFNFLTVLTITLDGLVQVEEMNLYAAVVELVVIKQPKNHAGIRPPDKILIVKETDRRSVSLLSFRSGRIHVGASIEIPKPLVGVTACVCRFHRGSQMVGLHSAHGLVKFFRIARDGTLKHFAKQPEQVMEEINVIDFQFFYNPGQLDLGLCVAILHVDHSGRIFVSSHPISDLGHTISRIPIAHQATVLLPLPQSIRGFAVFGGSSISFIDPIDPKRCKVRAGPDLVVTTAAALGKRTFLVGDENGDLFVVNFSGNEAAPSSEGNDKAVTAESREVTAIHSQRIGVTSSPSCLVNLDNGIVFVGSELGNSQIIRLLDPGQQADAQGTAAETVGGEVVSGLQVLQEFVNIGPIVDFCVVDMERHGQCRMVACTGAYADGAVSFIQNGISLQEEAVVDVVGMNNVWALHAPEDPFHSMLVQSFTSETRVMRIEGGEMGEVTESFAPVFDVFSRSIYCANVAAGDRSFCLQVTPQRISVGSVPVAREESESEPKELKPAALLAQWSPEANTEITHASAAGSDLIAAVINGKTIIVLRFACGSDGCGSFTQIASRQLSDEVSSLHIADVAPVGGASRVMVFAGTWTDNSLHVLQATDLVDVVVQPLVAAAHIPGKSQSESNGDTAGPSSSSSMARARVPRDILHVRFGADQKGFVFVGLRDGGLVVLTLELGAVVQLGAPTAITIGSTPISLALLTSSAASPGQPTVASTATRQVFIACDRPTVAAYRNGRLVYSVVNIRPEDEDEDGEEDDDVDDNSEPTDSGNGDAGAEPVSKQRPQLAIHSATVFNARDFPNALAFVTPEYMCIGTVDDLQSQLHVEKFNLGEQPRRITHLATSSAIAVGTVRWQEKMEESSIRVFNDQTCSELARLDLDTSETICALTTIFFKGQEYIVAGTAFQREGSLEPNVGRILVLALRRSVGATTTAECSEAESVSLLPCTLHIEAQVFTKGAVFSVKEFCSNTSSCQAAAGALRSVSTDQQPSRKILRREDASSEKASTTSGGTASRNPWEQGVAFLAAGVNDTVLLISLSSAGTTGADQQSGSTAPTLELCVESKHCGGVVSLFVDTVPGDNTIVVGDVMKSVRVLSYQNVLEALALIAEGKELTAKDSISGRTTKPQLIEVAKDFNSASIAALKCLTSRIYLCADDSGNLFTLRRKGGVGASSSSPESPSHQATSSATGGGSPKKQTDGDADSEAVLSDEQRFRLERLGMMHWGGMVNRIECGSLVMQPVNTAGADQATSAQASAGDAAVAAASSSASSSVNAGSSGSSSADQFGGGNDVDQVGAAGRQFILGTSNGTVGVVACIPKSVYVNLFHLMRAMEDTAFHTSQHPVDDHERWRSFVDPGGPVLSR